MTDEERNLTRLFYSLDKENQELAWQFLSNKTVGVDLAPIVFFYFAASEVPASEGYLEVQYFFRETIANMIQELRCTHYIGFLFDEVKGKPQYYVGDIDRNIANHIFDEIRHKQYKFKFYHNYHFKIVAEHFEYFIQKVLQKRYDPVYFEFNYRTTREDLDLLLKVIDLIQKLFNVQIVLNLKHNLMKRLKDYESKTYNRASKSTIFLCLEDKPQNIHPEIDDSLVAFSYQIFSSLVEYIPYEPHTSNCNP